MANTAEQIVLDFEVINFYIMRGGKKMSEEMVCTTTEAFEADGGWIVEMRVYQSDQSQSRCSVLLQRAVIFLGGAHQAAAQSALRHKSGFISMRESLYHKGNLTG